MYSVFVGLMAAIQATDHFISFIMPCYNCVDKVEKAIESIYAQTIAYPFEVICCNDASTDETLAVLRHCKKRFPNLKIAKHAYNKGAGAAANTCIKHAEGDLLFRLDADNILAGASHNTINRLVEILGNTGCDAAMVEYMILFEGNKDIKAIMRYEAPNRICDLNHCISAAHDPAMSGNFLFRRSAYDRVGGYPEDHGSDTFRFGFKIYATGGKIVLLKDAFYWHFYNPNGYWWREQKTGNNDEKALETVLCYKDLFSNASQYYLEDAYKNKGSFFALLHNKQLFLRNK